MSVGWAQGEVRERAKMTFWTYLSHDARRLVRDYYTANLYLQSTPALFSSLRYFPFLFSLYSEDGDFVPSP